ncbi:MAG: peptidylprolyl isomerase [Pseudomonadota bacterium]
MTFGKHILGATFAVFAGLQGAVAQDSTPTTVVADVNGTQITVGHMLAIKQQLPQQYTTLPDDILFEGILDQLIQQTLLAQTVNAEPSWIQVSLENEKRSILSSITIDKVRGTAVTDEALQAAYVAGYQNIPSEKEFNASHILVETEETAQELVAALGNGADFAELAAEKSTGPSGPNGGQLGWFGLGRMVPEFELAVVNLDVGQVSDPVQTQFGWHVIRLNDMRNIEPPTLEDVRDELEQGLQDAAVEAKLAELLAVAAIERNTAGVLPDVLSTLDLESME